LWVDLFKGDSQKLLRLTPVAMVTKIRKFQHKIGYNLLYLTDMTRILAPGRGFLGSACLKVTVRNAPTDPLLPW